MLFDDVGYYHFFPDHTHQHHTLVSVSVVSVVNHIDSNIYDTYIQFSVEEQNTSQCAGQQLKNCAKKKVFSWYQFDENFSWNWFHENRPWNVQ